MQYIYGKDTSLETFVIYVHSCLVFYFFWSFCPCCWIWSPSSSVEAERRVVRPLASKPGGTAVRFPCGARKLSPVYRADRMSTWLHRDLEKKNEREIDTNLMKDPEKNAVSNPSFQNDLYPLSLSPALLLRFRDQRNKEKRKRVHGPKRSECKWLTGLMSKTEFNPFIPPPLPPLINQVPLCGGQHVYDGQSVEERVFVRYPNKLWTNYLSPLH